MTLCPFPHHGRSICCFFFKANIIFSATFTRNCNAHITQTKLPESDSYVLYKWQPFRTCQSGRKLLLFVHKIAIKLCFLCFSLKNQASLDHNLKHQRIDRFPEINSVFRYIIANLNSIELKSFQMNIQEQQTQNLAPSCSFLSAFVPH